MRCGTKEEKGGGARGLDLGLDVRYAVRSLSRTPAFTAAVLVTLVLGIGSTTAMFSVVDAALWQSLPFRAPDRLVMGRAIFNGNINPWASFPDYQDYRDEVASFVSLATIGGGAGTVAVTGVAEPRQVRAVTVTANLFETLGVRPVLGGTFSIEEQPRGGGGQVVLSHSFWQDWFGGAPDVVGRSLVVQGEPLTVAGVMPPGFRFMYDTDLWIPPWAGNSDPITRRYHNWLLVGRLRPGASLDGARAEADVVSARLATAYPDSNRNKALRLDQLHAAMAEEYRPSLLLLGGGILLVLLVACGNVASLLMARGSARGPELAVRAALGAGRSRLSRQLLVESAVLAGTAGIIGFAVATVLQKLILAFVAMDRLGIGERGPSLGMLATALGVSAATVLLFGAYPSLSAGRVDPAQGFRSARSGTSRGTVRYRSVLVVLQVAVSLVLLVTSGLLMRSFSRLADVDPGFRVEGLLTAYVRLPDGDYRESERRVQFFEEARREIAALPGVESVAFTTHVPIRERYGNYSVWNPEAPPEAGVRPPWADRRVILPGYFETMEIPLVAGRVFDEGDVEGAPNVIVLSRRAVELLFPDVNAVGRPVAVDVGADEPGIFEVVGVVENHLTSSLSSSVRPVMFFPHAQRAERGLRVAVASSDPLSLVRPIQERLWEMDRDVLLQDPRTLEDVVSSSIGGARSITAVLGIFAAVAAALAAFGLYGVLSFLVTRRRHEIGIRVALGASSGSVLRLVLRRGLVLAAAGTALGIGGAVVATRLVQGMLFQTGARDPGTFAGVTILYLLVATLACLLPAWRALGIDPVEAFRSE